MHNVQGSDFLLSHTIRTTFKIFNLFVILIFFTACPAQRETIRVDRLSEPFKVSFTTREMLTAEVDSRLQVDVIFNQPAPADFNLTIQPTGNSTATEGDDYLFSGPNPIEIRKGQRGLSFEIQIIEDSVFEGDEYLSLELVGDSGFEFGTYSEISITISESIPAVTATMLTSRATVVEEQMQVDIEFQLSSAVSTEVRISMFINSSLSTAIEPNDFTLSSREVVIPANQLTGRVSILVEEDQAVEVDEDVVINFTSSSVSLLNASFILTIQNDDFPTLSVDPLSVSLAGDEGDSLRASLVTDFAAPFDIYVTLTPDSSSTALLGTDISHVGVVRIPAFSQRVSFDIQIIEDQFAERAETYRLNLEPPNTVVLGVRRSVTVNIRENDQARIQFEQTVGFQSEVVGNYETTVLLSNPVSEPITLNFVYNSNLSNATQGVDANHVATVIVPAGSVTANLSVTILDDQNSENTEDYVVDMFPVSNSLITMGAATQHKLRILDDERIAKPEINFDTLAITVDESADLVSMTITSDIPVPSTVTGTLDAGGGSANRNQDYALEAVSFTIPQGAMRVTLNTIRILEDQRQENAETFNVRIPSVSSNANRGPDRAVVVTILDND